MILDGSASDGDFPVSAANTFLPGNKITIAAGYDSNDALILSGLIIGQRIDIDRTARPKLTVEIADQAMTMTLERNNAVFANIKDSELIQKLITSNGLTASVTATTTVYEDVVQYYATDWDLMVMRAELNGFVVIADSGKVTVVPPNTQATPVLRVEYGASILDLNAEMNAATQYKSSAIKGFIEHSTQKMVEAGPGPLNVTEPGNLSSDKLASTFAVSTFTQQTGAMIPSSGLQDWSTAELLKSKLSKIRGQVTSRAALLRRPAV